MSRLLRAHAVSDCPFCAKKIWPGDRIGKLYAFASWVHARCYFDSVRTPERTTTSRDDRPMQNV